MQNRDLFAILGLAVLGGLTACTKTCTTEVEPIAKSDSIERTYLVKGMFCGGCSVGVRAALKKAGLADNQIVEVDHSSPDPNNKIGHATVRFQKSKYKGLESDCRLIEEVRKSPGYPMYLSSDNQDPCGLESK